MWEWPTYVLSSLVFVFFSYVHLRYYRKKKKKISENNGNNEKNYTLLLMFFRTQAVGFMLVLSRLGATFTPYMITSLKYMNSALPFVILVILNLITGTMNFYVSETKHRPIVDTIEEAVQALEDAKKKREDMD